MGTLRRELLKLVLPVVTLLALVNLTAAQGPVPVRSTVETAAATGRGDRGGRLLHLDPSDRSLLEHDYRGKQGRSGRLRGLRSRRQANPVRAVREDGRKNMDSKNETSMEIYDPSLDTFE